MVLDADLDPDDLSSVRSVVSGTAPLDPDDADAFIAKYGVPVLISYAATEFGGGVAGWNIEDHRSFWAPKRGSVGRAHAGCELRVVDPATGQVLEPDREGLLEVKASQLGRDGWVRTTDLARSTPTGSCGSWAGPTRPSSAAASRCGPRTSAPRSERHPRPRRGGGRRADTRLGAVPVAVVELRPDAG